MIVIMPYTTRSLHYETNTQLNPLVAIHYLDLLYVLRFSNLHQQSNMQIALAILRQMRCWGLARVPAILASEIWPQIHANLGCPPAPPR